MVFEIPDPFKWNESFRTFYEQIDEEHKGLFDGIFACCEKNDAATLQALVAKVKEHFENEEKLMTEKKYSDLDAHKAIHAKFIGDLNGLSAPLKDDKIIYAKEWLVNHIKGTDFKYKDQLD
uniref:Hemerythrin n=1 Tax=Nephtys incisa TaxID=492768 RepID=A0A1S6QCP7_9ANNE|nr:hemerythrin [Nephtys incisa]